MIPSTHQFRRWTLPTRWTFAASIGSLIGVVLAIVALGIAVAGPSLERERERTAKRHALVFQAAQELRSNSELLAQIGSLEAGETLALGTNPYSVGALKALTSGHFAELTKDATARKGTFIKRSFD
jgi:type II secretory pathway pseudopilin PulG